MRYTQNINLPIVEDNDLYSKEINNLAFEKIDEEIQGLADIVETLDSPENSIADVKKNVKKLNEQLETTVRFKKIEEEKIIIKEGNSIQLYTDEERVIESYPITSPDRVIYKNGISVEEKLRNVFIQSTMPTLVEEGDIWKEVLEDGKVRERVYNGGGTGTEVDYDVLHYETSEDLIVGQVENLAETGYKKLPGGLILQWGRVQPSSNQSGYASQQVTLPVTFPKMCLGAFANVNDVSGSHESIGDYKCNAYGNNSAIVVRANGSPSTKITIRWFALGI